MIDTLARSWSRIEEVRSELEGVFAETGLPEVETAIDFLQAAREQVAEAEALLDGDG